MQASIYATQFKNIKKDIKETCYDFFPGVASCPALPSLLRGGGGSYTAGGKGGIGTGLGGRKWYHLHVHMCMN